MKAVYNPLEIKKEFVLPEDFEGFHPDHIEQIKQIRKDQKVQTDMCLARDSDQLKGVLRYRLKQMGFLSEKIYKRKYGTYIRLAKQTGISASTISGYFNHNRYIWNAANGKNMKYISQTNLIILCLFAGVRLRIDIELEPLELIK